MYITEAVERVRAYCGTEYSEEEIVSWCNELSADLRLNYLCGARKSGAEEGADAAADNTEQSEDNVTVCGAPYDAMYIDFCMAKIAWFQRDFDVYNELIAAFNRKLYEYAQYLRRGAGEEPETKIKNWLGTNV